MGGHWHRVPPRAYGAAAAGAPVLGLRANTVTVTVPVTVTRLSAARRGRSTVAFDPPLSALTKFIEVTKVHSAFDIIDYSAYLSDFEQFAVNCCLRGDLHASH